MNYIYDSYINRFESYQEGKLEVFETPDPQSLLAFLTDDITIKPFKFKKQRYYQKFIRKFSEKSSVSVYEDEGTYIVFSAEKTIIQNIYNSFNSYPFPFQILFLKYLKNINHLSSTNIFLEKIEDKNIRITVITEKKGIATKIANIQSFQSLMNDTISGLNKKGFVNINFFILDKTLRGFLNKFEPINIEYGDLFAMFENIDKYIFKEPKENIKNRIKIRNIKDAALIATSFVLLIYSGIVYQNMSGNIAMFNSKINILSRNNNILYNKLKKLSSERFLYILRKQPQYSEAIINILSKFPEGAFIKSINITRVSGGRYKITGIGYTSNSYRDFVSAYNKLKISLSGIDIKIASFMTKTGKPYFYLSGDIK